MHRCSAISQNRRAPQSFFGLRWQAQRDTALGPPAALAKRRGAALPAAVQNALVAAPPRYALALMQLRCLRSNVREAGGRQADFLAGKADADASRGRARLRPSQSAGSLCRCHRSSAGSPRPTTAGIFQPAPSRSYSVATTKYTKYTKENRSQVGGRT